MIQFTLLDLIKKKGYVGPDGKIQWRQLSRNVDIDHVTLWKLAHNKPYNPSLKMLARLCDAFDCKIDDLMVYKPNIGITSE